MRRAAIAATMLGAVLAAGAGGQEVRLEVSPVELTLEQQAVLALTVEGADAQQPALPALAGFDARYHGEHKQASFVNGRFSRQSMYRWVLTPKQTGEFTIGPIEIAIDGEIRRSNAVPVRVLPPSNEPIGERLMFTRATVSNRRPFVGEQVVYVWRFYRRARIADPRLDPLDLGGFLVEELGGVREYRTVEGGAEYEVSEIRRALFAQRAGSLTIPASRLQVQLVTSSPRSIDPFDRRRSSPFDEFFGRLRTEGRTLATDPITVEVRALPPAPADFSGLVGSFDLESTVSTSTLGVGESLTQKIVVSGAGNLHLMGELPLPEAHGFKVYGDQPSTAIERSGALLHGRKTFTRALVPLEPGAVELPPVALVYFDPQAERYVRAETQPVSLDVHPAEGEDLRLTESLGAGGGKVAVRILGEDLLPIHRGLELVERRSSLLLPALFLLPPLAYVGLLAARRRADRHAADTGIRRRRTALRRALGALDRLGEPLDPSAAAAAVRRFLGDRLGAPGGALTSRECLERLAAQAGAGEAVARTGEVLARLEGQAYGGGAGAPVTAAELRALLERLDRDLRRSRRENGGEAGAHGG